MQNATCDQLPDEGSIAFITRTMLRVCLGTSLGAGKYEKQPQDPSPHSRRECEHGQRTRISLRIRIRSRIHVHVETREAVEDENRPQDRVHPFHGEIFGKVRADRVGICLEKNRNDSKSSSVQHLDTEQETAGITTQPMFEANYAG